MAAGSIVEAVMAAHNMEKDLPVEVEVENEEELQQALQAGADRILLDNFTVEEIRAAVTITNNASELEASGGITLGNLRAYAETGVDYISVGALTKDVRAIDLSLRFD